MTGTKNFEIIRTIIEAKLPGLHAGTDYCTNELDFLKSTPFSNIFYICSHPLSQSPRVPLDRLRHHQCSRRICAEGLSTKIMKRTGK